MSEDTVIMDLSEFQNREPPKINHRKSYYGRIEEYTIDGTYIRTWENSAEAAEYHNVIGGTISRCCAGGALIVNKLQRIFIKEGDSIESRLDEIEKRVYHTSTRKPVKVAVEEYDINGNFIKAYESITEIQNCKNPVQAPTVRNVCSGKLLYSKIGKRIFLYSGASIKVRLEMIKQARYDAAMNKSVDEYSKDGELIKHWKSVSDITAEYDIPPVKILDCCSGESNSVKRKIFLFSGESIKKRLKRIKSKKKIK